MKLLHKIAKGASLTGALFVLEACYGVPEPAIYQESGEAPMTFRLEDRATGSPLGGVQILASGSAYWYDQEPLGVTADDGTCRVNLPYVRNMEGPFIHFADTAGHYQPKDTTLADLRDRTVVVKLDAAE